MLGGNVTGLAQTAVLGFLVFLLSSTGAFGATYYVRTDGNNANTGLANTSGGAWRTIDWGADHVTAGDVVRVQAGTYVEVASPGVSGTSGNTVTLVTDGTVTTCGMIFSGRSYIRVIGFTMNGNTSGCSAGGARVAIIGTNTGLEFWNNALDNTDEGYLINSNDRCQSCIILGGSVRHVNNTANGITITGNDSFVGYVDFNSICYLGVNPSGNRLRFVNLNFQNMIPCNGSHPDFFYFQGLNSFGYSNSLIESVFGIGTTTSTDNKGMHAQNQQPTAWNDNIWRLSVARDLGSGFFSMYTDGGAGASNRWRFYNNSIINCNRANNSSSYSNCGNISISGSVSIYNNLFYQAWADAVTSGITPWAESSGSFTKDYNLAYDPNGSVGFGSAWTSQAHARSNVNPQLTNVAGDDFTLGASSGARGTGGPLTVATSCSGTTLNVTAGTGSYFIGNNSSNLAAYGGALVPGDFLTINATTYQVVSRSNDALTLSASLTCSNGNAVYFGKSSTIDIGAYPYMSGGSALSAGYAIAGGTATITTNDASLVRFVVCYSDNVPYAVDNSSPYTCAAPAGTFSARVYPRYASRTLWTTAVVGALIPPAAPSNLQILD